MKQRIITTDLMEEELETEGSLRPQYLEDYIGQQKVKENLKIFIEAAKQRGDVLDHVLFYGPPGLGKTTLAGIIANEMGTHMKVTSGPAIEKPGEMAAILNNLQEGDILFIDEIHRFSKSQQDSLLHAVETGTVTLSNSSSVLNLRNNPWTGRILTTLQNGTNVTILGTEGRWYKIQWGSTVGYVHSDYIKI